MTRSRAARRLEVTTFGALTSHEHLGGSARSDTKSHGYQGHGFAVAGVILGACALAIGFVTMVLLTS